MKSLGYFCVFVTAISFIGVSSKVVSDLCLACLCEAATNCKQDVGCVGDVCGAFQITPAFWKDAGEVVMGQKQGDAFSACANSLECASRSVENYMSKYQKDCNGDGKINCDDFVLIHKYGPYGCERSLTPDNLFLETYIQCKIALSP